MNTVKRAEVVKAMETIARCVNDETVFDAWLSCGVADGDLPSANEDWDDKYSHGYYIQDDKFSELMDTFLRLMYEARTSGGLYCDGVVSK